MKWVGRVTLLVALAFFAIVLASNVLADEGDEGSTAVYNYYIVGHPGYYGGYYGGCGWFGCGSRYSYGSRYGWGGSYYRPYYYNYWPNRYLVYPQSGYGGHGYGGYGWGGYGRWW